MFELSLQSVDPSLSLPYWDPSIEMAAVAEKELKDVWGSPLWSETMFGSINGYVAETYNMTEAGALAEVRATDILLTLRSLLPQLTCECPPLTARACLWLYHLS